MQVLVFKNLPEGREKENSIKRYVEKGIRPEERKRLLKTAAANGCLVVDGVEMFVYQGAIQFKLWTGLEAPLETMRQSVIGALGVVAPEITAAGESR